MAELTSNRWQVFNEFVDETMRHLTPAEVLAWLVLFRDAKRGGRVRTAQKDIARRGGRSARAVGDAVRSLIALGLLRLERRGTLNSGPSVYRLRGSSAAVSQRIAASEPPPDAEVETATAELPPPLPAAEAGALEAATAA